ncbi:hypothetical protein CYMTET_20927 [Cymbomonas tetramitiformis]|uniref:Uncharacterized protein n=1 Tax=Cymbomonas tetramitiformis TaxID=36881 RepID=A0AAE0G3T4_9CHLO|nr:hypothetical protein CYMTET_20927 [Cymbomonas tetramitiformis]
MGMIFGRQPATRCESRQKRRNTDAGVAGTGESRQKRRNTAKAKGKSDSAAPQPASAPSSVGQGPRWSEMLNVVPPRQPAARARFSKFAGFSPSDVHRTRASARKSVPGLTVLKKAGASSNIRRRPPPLPLLDDLEGALADYYEPPEDAEQDRHYTAPHQSLLSDCLPVAYRPRPTLPPRGHPQRGEKASTSRAQSTGQSRSQVDRRPAAGEWNQFMSEEDALNEAMRRSLVGGVEAQEEEEEEEERLPHLLCTDIWGDLTEEEAMQLALALSEQDQEQGLASDSSEEGAWHMDAWDDPPPQRRDAWDDPPPQAGACVEHAWSDQDPGSGEDQEGWQPEGPYFWRNAPRAEVPCATPSHAHTTSGHAAYASDSWAEESLRLWEPTEAGLRVPTRHEQSVEGTGSSTSDADAGLWAREYNHGLDADTALEAALRLSQAEAATTGQRRAQPATQHALSEEEELSIALQQSLAEPGSQPSAGQAAGFSTIQGTERGREKSAGDASTPMECFKRWANDRLQPLTSEVDNTALVDMVLSMPAMEDMQAYIVMYVGPHSVEFSEEFVAYLGALRS